MKIHFSELQNAGFKQHGNWCIKGNISINLLGDVVSHNTAPDFSIDADDFPALKKATLRDVTALSYAMATLTGREKN